MNWPTIDLEECCKLITDGTHQSPEFTHSGVPFLFISNIIDNRLDFSETKHISKYTYEELNRRCPVEIGDVLYATVGSYGSVALVGEYCKFSFQRHIAHIKPNLDMIFPEYLFFILQSYDIKKQVDSRVRGIAQKTLNLGELRSLRLPLPSMVEQKRIAAILDKADAIRRMRRESVIVAEELLRSTFLEMFGDPVTNPKGWPTCPLSDIADIASGVTKGRKLASQALISAPYLRVANVQDGFLNLKEIKHIDILPHELDKYRLIHGDVLLTEGGDPDKLGRGCVWQNEVQDCIHQNHIFRVRVRQDTVTPEFLSALVGSKYGKRYFLRSAKQTTGIASINMTQLRAFPVLLTDHKLQAQFSGLTQRYKGLWDVLSVAATTQQETFDSLLHRAFRGELTQSESAPRQLSIFDAESKHS